MTVKNNTNRAILFLPILVIAAAAFVPRLLQGDVKRFLAGKERAPEAQKVGPSVLFLKDAVPEGIVVRPGKLIFEGKNLPPDKEVESQIFAAARNYLGSSKTQTATRQHRYGSITQEVFVSRSGENILTHYSLVKKNTAWFLQVEYCFDEKSQKLSSISVDLPDWKSLKVTAPLNDYLYDSVSSQCSPANTLHYLEEAFTSWPEKMSPKTSSVTPTI